jgi:hypothetical protein
VTASESPRQPQGLDPAWVTRQGRAQQRKAVMDEWLSYGVRKGKTMHRSPECGVWALHCQDDQGCRLSRLQCLCECHDPEHSSPVESS